MPEMSGSFSGTTRVETTLRLSDVPGHELRIAEITGSQRSTDDNWNNAGLVYWGVLDLVDGSGTQRGDYVNERDNGERECGTFEGKVTTGTGTDDTRGHLASNLRNREVQRHEGPRHVQGSDDFAKRGGNVLGGPLRTGSQ